MCCCVVVSAFRSSRRNVLRRMCVYVVCAWLASLIAARSGLETNDDSLSLMEGEVRVNMSKGKAKSYRVNNWALLSQVGLFLLILPVRQV